MGLTFFENGEASTLTFDRAPGVPIAQLVDEVKEQLRTEIANRTAQLEVNVGDHVIWGNHERFRIMLHYLIDNAIKFNTHEHPRVLIQADQEKSQTRLTVTDNGIGIEPEHRDQVFGLFKRLDPSFSGTGIGLALVARIAEAHGGEVWIERAPEGDGCSFMVSLPNRPEQAS